MLGHHSTGWFEPDMTIFRFMSFPFAQVPAPSNNRGEIFSVAEVHSPFSASPVQLPTEYLGLRLRKYHLQSSYMRF
jgi:hypothetical protein